jgi:nucleoside-diphosphate-sugar epimerase
VDDRTAALIGLAVWVGMRIVDRLLPDGYHLTALERWLKKNDEREKQWTAEDEARQVDRDAADAERARIREHIREIEQEDKADE